MKFRNVQSNDFLLLYSFHAVSLQEMCRNDLCEDGIPIFARKVLDVLWDKNVQNANGVGRKPGNKAKVDELERGIIETDQIPDLSQPADVNHWYVVVSLFKRFLTKLGNRVIDQPISRFLNNILSKYF